MFQHLSKKKPRSMLLTSRNSSRFLYRPRLHVSRLIVPDCGSYAIYSTLMPSLIAARIKCLYVFLTLFATYVSLLYDSLQVVIAPSPLAFPSSLSLSSPVSLLTSNKAAPIHYKACENKYHLGKAHTRCCSSPGTSLWDNIAL